MNARAVGLAGAIVGLIATLATAQEPKQEDQKVTGTIVHPPIGKPAPPIAVGKWIKGEPVTRFAPGKVYVVAFWNSTRSATRAGLLRLSELHEEHPDVPFLAVAAFEQDPADVERSVASLGKGLNLSVALDEVPPDAGAAAGAMASAWLKPRSIGPSLLPYAYVIKDGRIALAGVPECVEACLPEILAPRFAFDQSARNMNDSARRLTCINRLGAAWIAQDFDEAAAILDWVFAEDLDRAIVLGGKHVQRLLDAGRDAEAAAYLTRFAARDRLGDVEVANTAAEALSDLAYSVLSPTVPRPASPALHKAALAAATRANDLAGGKDGWILDTLARAYFVNGDTAKAVETQQKAIDVTRESDPLMTDPLMKDRLLLMKVQLEQYREAAGE